jgi:hypothetical protein
MQNTEQMFCTEMIKFDDFWINFPKMIDFFNVKKHAKIE